MSKKKKRLQRLRQETEEAVCRHAHVLAEDMNIRLFCDMSDSIQFEADPVKSVFWVERIEVIAFTFPQKKKRNRVMEKFHRLLDTVQDRVSGRIGREL